jgi:hypothetical protein
MERAAGSFCTHQESERTGRGQVSKMNNHVRDFV